MKELLIILASAVIVYLISVPVITWVHKAKEEMGENNDRAE